MDSFVISENAKTRAYFHSIAQRLCVLPPTQELGVDRASWFTREGVELPASTSVAQALELAKQIGA